MGYRMGKVQDVQFIDYEVQDHGHFPTLAFHNYAQIVQSADG
jgi:hypothetical protein